MNIPFKCNKFDLHYLAMKSISVIFCFLMVSGTYGQDTLRIMYFNLLNFPSNDANRYVYQRTFLQYAQPDVFVVNELDSEAGADLILDSTLNVNGVDHFQRAAFIDGNDTDNGLFYNSDKLGLIDQLQLGTVLRDISVYKLYYKAPNLSAQSDTIYCWFLSCHLKAGTGDYEQRNLEAQQAKYYLNDISDEVENVFFGGDFNFYSGYESGCQTILNTGAVPMIDPANAIGNWSGDFGFADWHTQSTRNNGFGSGTGGGMDDRFDLIFVSEDVMNNDNGITYINGSYKPLGQDGTHFNDAVNAGTNFAVPDSVADALYYASDHLPVMLDVALDETAAVPEIKNEYVRAYYNSQGHSINFLTSAEGFELVLYDLMGKVVLKTWVNNKIVPLPEDMKGIYVWSIKSAKVAVSDRITIF